MPNIVKLGSRVPLITVNPYEQMATDLTSRFLDRVLNSPVEGCVNMLERDGIKVLAKDTSDGILMWSEFKVPFNPQQFMAFMSKIEKRKLWDTNIAEVKKVCQANPNTFVTYTIYKRFLTISSRDLVLLSTQGQHGDSLYEASSSIEMEEFPVNKSHIRAKMHLGGYFLTPVKVDSGEVHCKVVNFSESNVGGSLPMSLIMKMSATAIPKYVQSLCAAMSKELSQSS